VDGERFTSEFAGVLMKKLERMAVGDRPRWLGAVIS
jgi:hypothetical protein